MRVGFIGLGMMGLPMAENLARAAGVELLCHDASAEQMNRLCAHEAHGKTLSVAEGRGAFCDREIVVLMLPNSLITNAVVLGDESTPGLVDVLSPGAMIIDMGSSNPGDTRRLQARCGKAGIALVDAPVSGAVAKARTGELTILFGGDDAQFERARPVLEAMGTTLIRAGAVSAGHALKAINNYVYAAGLLAVSEALMMGRALELDEAVLAHVLNTSSGRNVASETKLAQFMSTGTFNGGFALRLMAKDLATAAGIATEEKLDAPQLELCTRMWREACAALEPTADNTEIFRFLQMGQRTPMEEISHAAD